MISDLLQIGFFVLVLLLLTPLLGTFMAAVFEGRNQIITPVFGWLERLIYKLSGVDQHEAMDWRKYLSAVLWFSVISGASLFLLQLFQGKLPLNPNHMGNVEWTSALNTAISFMTNTNWQGYSGETTMSYLTQMLGLCSHNFLSAAAGITVMLALIRGLVRKNTTDLGNFWVDLTRTTVYILIPLSIVWTLAFVSQGMIQNFTPNKTVVTVEGQKQVLPQGPVASQVAIKDLGTNGGGFFNANSAHPYENPTPLSNFLITLALLLIPASLVYSFGIMIGSRKHALMVFLVMLAVFLAGLTIALSSEYATGHLLGTHLLEGKETRFGVGNSVLYAVATTVVSNGSVNAMHASLSPLAGGVAMFNIMLGEIIFGGVGSGMYGMILFIILTVFLAGLMAGRTPEYLGKKIEKKEILLAIIGILFPGICILVGTSLAVILPIGLSSITSAGPHGFDEILYAFSSAAGNNGSAFAGLNANTPFYNIALGVAMLVGRFGVIIPALMIAGSFAGKKTIAVSSGTFPTNNGVFAVLLFSVILIVAGLTFFPALALGPILDHLLLFHHQILF